MLLVAALLCGGLHSSLAQTAGKEEETKWIEVLKSNAEFTAKADACRELGRVGTAEDVADMVVFLLGRRSSYLTGQNVVLDGGSVLTSGQMDPVLGPLLDQFGGPPPG